MEQHLPPRFDPAAPFAPPPRPGAGASSDDDRRSPQRHFARAGILVGLATAVAFAAIVAALSMM